MQCFLCPNTATKTKKILVSDHVRNVWWAKTISEWVFALCEILFLLGQRKQTGCFSCFLLRFVVSLPDGKCQIRIRLLTTRIILDVSNGGIPRQNPLVTFNVICHINFLQRKKCSTINGLWAGWFFSTEQSTGSRNCMQMSGWGRLAEFPLPGHKI